MAYYGKTKRFRDVLKDLKHTIRYSGKDEDGQPKQGIYFSQN
jgi:hypothetical protein